LDVLKYGKVDQFVDGELNLFLLLRILNLTQREDLGHLRAG